MASLTKFGFLSTATDKMGYRLVGENGNPVVPVTKNKRIAELEEEVSQLKQQLKGLYRELYDGA
jgi:hypothetical protein